MRGKCFVSHYVLCCKATADDEVITGDACSLVKVGHRECLSDCHFTILQI